MNCILCGKVDDYDDSGLCRSCRKYIGNAELDERLELLDLLNRTLSEPMTQKLSETINQALTRNHRSINSGQY